MAGYHNIVHTPDARGTVLWWVQLCRWLWKLVAVVGLSVVLSLAVSVLATWLTSPQGQLPATSPFAWLLARWFVVLPVGLCFLLLALLIGVLSRWPTTEGGMSRSKSAEVPPSVSPGLPSLPVPTGGHRPIPLDQSGPGALPIELDIPKVTPIGLPRAVPFVGREHDLQEVMSKLQMGETIGVCALAGMGGVGKTALAAEAVGRLLAEGTSFPGGAVWISCGGLKGEVGLAELWTRVAWALTLWPIAKLSKREEKRVRLGHALTQARGILLTLDNVEAELSIDPIIQTLAVPGHTVLLLTARQTLAPYKLNVVELRPLELATAQRLFVARLQQVDPTRPSPEEASALSDLLGLLDGLPLALELTATYAGLQKVALERIAQEVAAERLNATALDSPDGSIRACFDRSWQALDEVSQHLFASLSLLPQTGFPRIAAELLGQAHDNQQEPESKNYRGKKAMAALVHFSLLELLEHERIRLHPLLRGYAAERFLSIPPHVKAHLEATAHMITLIEQGVQDLGESLRARAWAKQHGYPLPATLEASVKGDIPPHPVGGPAPFPPSV